MPRFKKEERPPGQRAGKPGGNCVEAHGLDKRNGTGSCRSGLDLLGKARDAFPEIGKTETLLSIENGRPVRPECGCAGK